ncbi:cell wall / vacuolar inhibitor of fructosidase 2-like [Ananas comosus]|uniref:Cell wall / vacuolar inhibitor of fructosidase 2-like n=1 Tax=Ananas comosus TaxID=4615 RepID=A0A6P5FNQ9_ANACO|nr:cell wall / vacuolar inhibitor of fructosidase 2-like [Ananas comosus]
MATTLLLSLLLLLLSPLTFSVPTPTPTPTPTPLVRSTCNATTYYDLCVASLSSDPAAAAARDPTALSSILVSRAAADAANASAAAASLAGAAAAAEPSAAALRACAAKYAAARDALGRALAALAAAEYDYAFVHVGAAAEYPRACRALFRRQAPRLAFPAEIARREDALERLCTDALDIITLLGD